MDTNSNILLNRVFTRNAFQNIVKNQTEETYTAAIRRYINNPKGKNNQQLISEIYQELNKNYRNEYFYKNTLLNKLLLGVHSPRTTTALTEVTVNKSEADFILINGKAVVYEIKTELDNFERLTSQLKDYYNAFNYVSVVTSESQYSSVERRLSGTPVGIYVLNRRNSLSPRKKPRQYNFNLDLNVIFKVLRKAEYESILMNYYGTLPNVSQFRYYSTCQQMFCKINTMNAYNLFLKELKKRNHIELDLYVEVPYELKFVMYFLNLKRKGYQDLKRFLESKFGG